MAMVEASETTSLRRQIHCDVAAYVTQNILLVNVHLLEENVSD